MGKTVKWLTAAGTVVVLAGCLCVSAFAAPEPQDKGSERETVRQPMERANPDGAAGRTNSDEHKRGFHIDMVKMSSELLGKTEQEVMAALKDGKFGEMLIASGKLEQFKSSYLEQAMAGLEKAVADGRLTREQADKKFESIKRKIDEYDGTKPLQREKPRRRHE